MAVAAFQNAARQKYKKLGMDYIDWSWSLDRVIEAFKFIYFQRRHPQLVPVKLLPANTFSQLKPEWMYRSSPLKII